MTTALLPIGYVRTKAEKVPRHWTISDVVGELILEKEYREGLRDIKKGEKIVVLFLIATPIILFFVSISDR